MAVHSGLRNGLGIISAKKDELSGQALQLVESDPILVTGGDDGVPKGVKLVRRHREAS